MTDQTETTLRLRWCPECHYDISKLPASHACPECGLAYHASMFDLERVHWEPLRFHRPWLARTILYGGVGLVALGTLVLMSWTGLLSMRRLGPQLLVMGAMLSLMLWIRFHAEPHKSRVVMQPEGFRIIRSRSNKRDTTELYRWVRFKSVDGRRLGDGCWRLSFRGRSFMILRVHVREEEAVVQAAMERMRQWISDWTVVRQAPAESGASHGDADG